MRRNLCLALPGLLLAACAPVPVAPVRPEPRPLRIGLALGGGAARGFAHIGAIKVLEANGITPDMIIGTSAGSVIGALYAAGFSGYQLHELALKMDENEIADWAIPFLGQYGGVIKGEALQNYINRMVRNRPIEQLARPLGIVATELQTGKAIVFRRGNTGMAVRASSSVPGVFQPVRIGGKDYVDGGLVAPVPVRLAREMGADFVIAVDISSRPSEQQVSGTVGVILQTTAIMGQAIKQQELQEAEALIQPVMPEVKSTDFTARHAAILAGEKAALAALPALKARLTQMREAGVPR
ncbi:MAG: patatin-like phospholipase family protein [Hydrogenophilaceae bacterium]|nr:patatin-like phospholipase family protein [Hydrogenophilaceae bacterium]